MSDGAVTIPKQAEPMLSVLVVNYNSWPSCVAALESLLASPPTAADGTPMPYEIVVVDNASPRSQPEHQARTRELVSRIGGKLILHDENGGYSKGMNLAYRHARGRWILVSNPDVLFRPGCIDALLRCMEQDDSVGAAAPENYWDRGLYCKLPPNILPTIPDLLATTWAGVSSAAVHRYSKHRTERALRVWLSEHSVDLDMLSGCCFLMRRSFIESIGFFDERFPLYYEDTDLSVRIRKAGKRIVQVYGSHLVHFYNRSGQTDHAGAMQRYWVSKRAYYRKWYGRAGQALFDVCRWFLSTPWARQRTARSPQPVIHEVPPSQEPPTLHLPRRCERFLVEISLDPRFYLAGGTFGSGELWTPPKELAWNFGPATFFFRVCDLSGGRIEPIGVWRFTRLPPQETRERPVPSPAEVSGR